MSDYDVLRARIGKLGADRAVAFGFIDPPAHSPSQQACLPLDEALPAPAPVPRKRKSRESELGQFMTPSSISKFMAGLFTDSFAETIWLLDAGAGRGALTSAFVARWKDSEHKGQIEAHAYELDEQVLGDLRANLAACDGDGITTNLYEGDFIERAATMIRLGTGARYTHAILNPPYKKIHSSSAHRAFLRAVGLETVNLYSAFVGLAVQLLEEGGQIVAIIPRSFCNGPYYRPFRRFILERAAIRHIHLFDARDKAFKDDGVLQENIIIRLERGGRQGPVTISTSADGTFSDYLERRHPFESIVFPNDTGLFLHVPTGADADAELLKITGIRHRLNELGLSVATGPVVDFRLRHDLRDDPEPGTVPLLYPGHFLRNRLQWPKPGFKKPNAIRHTRGTAKWLFPIGFYAVVRRFSSKEERRRNRGQCR